MTKETILIKRNLNLASRCKTPARYDMLVSSKIVSNKNLPKLKEKLAGKSISETSDILGSILRNKEVLYTWLRKRTGEPFMSTHIDRCIDAIEINDIDGHEAIMQLNCPLPTWIALERSWCNLS